MGILCGVELKRPSTSDRNAPIRRRSSCRTPPPTAEGLRHRHCPPVNRLPGHRSEYTLLTAGRDEHPRDRHAPWADAVPCGDLLERINHAVAHLPFERHELTGVGEALPAGGRSLRPYLPARKPPASGLQTRMPTSWYSANDWNSYSRPRPTRLYYICAVTYLSNPRRSCSMTAVAACHDKRLESPI